VITRLLYSEEKKLYDSKIIHPVQTWDWGEFQIFQGHKVYRLGVFDRNILLSAYSVSFHQIPKTNYSIGTLLRGPSTDQEMLTNIAKIARNENAVFVKFEPDVYSQKFNQLRAPLRLAELPQFDNLLISPKVAFYPYTFIVDLTKSEDELLESMHPKTRYNIKIANRYNVKIEEQTTDSGFEIYLKLLFETTKRQGFYLHTHQYHRDLWKIIKNTSLPHIFIASYQNQPLAAYLLFVLKDKIFYPYGASLDTFREVMAPTLLMWESIKFGKSLGLKTFDMWGSLGPDAKEGDNGFGFHRFKQGFGGELVQYLGTYDLVVNPNLYKLYNLVDKYRWKLLRLKAKLFSRFQG